MQWLHLTAIQSQIVSYKVKIILHMVAVSLALMFLYLKKCSIIFCLSLAFSWRHFILNFILFCNFAQFCTWFIKGEIIHEYRWLANIKAITLEYCDEFTDRSNQYHLFHLKLEISPITQT